MTTSADISTWRHKSTNLSISVCLSVCLSIYMYLSIYLSNRVSVHVVLNGMNMYHVLTFVFSTFYVRTCFAFACIAIYKVLYHRAIYRPATNSLCHGWQAGGGCHAAATPLVDHGKQRPQWTRRLHYGRVRATRSGGCLRSELTDGRQAITPRSAAGYCLWRKNVATV